MKAFILAIESIWIFRFQTELRTSYTAAKENATIHRVQNFINFLKCLVPLPASQEALSDTAREGAQFRQG